MCVNAKSLREFLRVRDFDGENEELKQQKTARVVSFKGLPNRNLHGFSSHTHTHIPLTYLLAYKLFMENEREKGAHSE